MGGKGKNTVNSNGNKLNIFRCMIYLLKNTFRYQNLEDKYTYVAIKRNAKSIVDYIVYSEELKHRLIIAE